MKLLFHYRRNRHSKVFCRYWRRQLIVSSTKRLHGFASCPFSFFSFFFFHAFWQGYSLSLRPPRWIMGQTKQDWATSVTKPCWAGPGAIGWLNSQFLSQCSVGPDGHTALHKSHTSIHHPVFIPPLTSSFPACPALLSSVCPASSSPLVLSN